MVIEVFIEIINICVSNRIDFDTNSQLAYVYDIVKKDFITVKWKDLKVGHIIKVYRDDIVPADIVILEAMDPNHLCYVDESSLTGVFDRYVVKKACSDTRSPNMKQVTIYEYIKNIKGTITYDSPNLDMKSFYGRLKLESHPRAKGVILENLMLRGSSLKNTKAIYGLVVYTGMDTKIMQTLNYKNKSNTRLKTVEKNENLSDFKDCLNTKNTNFNKNERNYLFKAMNSVQYIIVLYYTIILAIYVLNLIYKYRKLNNEKSNLYGYIYNSDANKNFIDANKDDLYYSIFEFSMIFQLIIPYSWYNLLFIAYYILSKFIQWDIKLNTSSKIKTEITRKDCIADYGQVKYILSDKTGTLTNRKFNLKGLSFEGELFINEDLQDKEEGLFIYNQQEPVNTKLNQMLKSNNQLDNLSYKLFVEELAVNHSATTWKEEIINNKANDDKYLNEVYNERKLGSAFSEEKALLKYLESLGIYLIKSLDKKVEMESFGEKKFYDIIGRNKYTNRKSSSIIYNKLFGESILLCKCYDFNQLSRLINRSYQVESETKIMAHGIKMQELGYRVVYILRKELDEEEAQDFVENYKSAENNIATQDDLYEKLAFNIEKNLNLVGALFFEENFSDDLKFALNKLKMANIHTFIVSGDRSNNVEAVARNLNMISNYTYQYSSNINNINADNNLINSTEVVNFYEDDNRQDIDIKIDSKLTLIFGKKSNIPQNIELNYNNSHNIKRTTTVFIHGKAFSIICKEARLYQTFAILLLYTNNLFASGFTPLDKYNLAKIMKKFLCNNCKLLAIGDGLNDVMMLKEADISIGIRSKEILQVKNTCDAIVSKFSQIPDMLIVHGTWNQNRIYQIVYYSLYTSLVIIMPYFFKQFFSEIYVSYSSDYMYLLLSLVFINILIILCFCFNQHVDRSLILISPQIYSTNFETTNNVSALLETLIRGLIDSSIVYYLNFLALDYVNNADGYTIDLYHEWFIILITSYLVVYTKLVFIQLKIINKVICLIIVLSFISIMTIGYIRISTLYSILEILSFLVVMLNILLSISVVLIYDYVLSNYNWYFQVSIINNIIKKYYNIIYNKDFLINYEELIEEFNSLEYNVKKNEYNTFENLIKTLHKDKIPVDNTIDNSKTY